MSIASELTNYKTGLTNVWNTLQNQGATIPANKNMQNVANAIDSISTGGGSVVNGVIEEYKASTSTISADTFVEFVSKTPTAGDDTQISTASSSGQVVSVAKLNDTTVFVAHNGDDGYLNKGSRLYGTVCTISGGTITAGASTKLSTAEYSGRTISVIVLDSTKVFIAYSTGSSHYLYGIVCTISGTTITAGTGTVLVSESSTQCSATMLDETHIFIARKATSRLYGIVCTISGTTITAGTNTQLSATSYGGGVISTETLNSAKVFIAYSGDASTTSDTSIRPYGIVCTISGTTITAGSPLRLTTVSYSGGAISTAKLNHTTVFVGCRSGSDYYLYGIVCTISGTTITAGGSSVIVREEKAGDVISAVGIGNMAVFIAHTKTSNYVLYGIVCTISGTTITAGTDVQLSSLKPYAGSDISAAVLSSNQIFVTHGGAYPYYLYATTASDLWTVREATSGGSICGLTKTACTTTTAGDVWVLNN